MGTPDIALLVLVFFMILFIRLWIKANSSQNNSDLEEPEIYQQGRYSVLRQDIDIAQKKLNRSKGQKNAALSSLELLVLKHHVVLRQKLENALIKNDYGAVVGGDTSNVWEEFISTVCKDIELPFDYIRDKALLFLEEIPLDEPASSFVSKRHPQDRTYEAVEKENLYSKINFHGTSREYFGIWIVNLLLSIVTLGIYSAWAKVRRLTYFNNKTEIQGYSFGYHATGSQILKGRVVAFVALIAINIISQIAPVAGGILAISLLFALPWFLNSSLKFGARMTSYRNIRLDWHGTYWKTFLFFLIGPLIGIVSFGLLYPLFSKKYYQYYATHHSYGTTRFESEPKTSSFYFAFLIAFSFPLLLIYTSVAASLFYSLDFPSEPLVQFVPLMLLWFFVGNHIYGTLCRNALLKSLKLQDVAAFGTTLQPLKYLWISLSNAVVIILSLGLMVPWAKIRAYKYLANSSEFIILKSMDNFVDDLQTKRNAFGEEFAEFEGIEAGI